MELGEQRRICVSSSFENVRKIADFCIKSCRKYFTSAELLEIELAVVEAANNIVEHSYKCVEGKPIEFSISCEQDSIKFTLINTGIAFMPPPQDEIPEMDWEKIEDIPEHGRGLFIIYSSMDEVAFFQEGNTNILLMIKKLPEPLKGNSDYYPFISSQTAGSDMTKKEMQTAVNLYRNFLPAKAPDIEGLALFSKTEPALLVGGDHLAFLKTDDSTLWFMICDVMGKGMSAAFFSMLSHMAFKSVLFLKQDISPGELLTLANKIMANDFDRFGMFMTAFMGKINLSEDTLYYASAGHCPPILYTKENDVELLDTQDFMMGVDEVTDYRTYSQPFLKGMKLMAYTDGITDITGPTGEMAGIEPLLYACSHEFKIKGIEDACEKIFEEALIVSGKQLQDDISMIGIERH